MPLNSTPGENGQNVALGITSIRRILRDNLNLEIDTRRRVASISDPVRRQWTESTLAIRDAVASKCADPNADEDEIMSAFFVHYGIDRMLDAQAACEVIMADEGPDTSELLERYFSTDSLWLVNKVRNAVDRVFQSHPTSERINGLGVLPPEAGVEIDFELAEASCELRDPYLNQAVGWGILSCGSEMPVIFEPQSPPVAPIVLHKILKTQQYADLSRVCDFGISRYCKNRMDHLLTFPLGNAITYWPTCTNCTVKLLDFIDEPEPGEVDEFFQPELKA